MNERIETMAINQDLRMKLLCRLVLLVARTLCGKKIETAKEYVDLERQVT